MMSGPCACSVSAIEPWQNPVSFTSAGQHPNLQARKFDPGIRAISLSMVKPPEAPLSWEMLNIEEALVLLQQGHEVPTVDDFISLSRKCRRQHELPLAKSVHMHICDHGVESHKVLGNFLVPMFVDCGSMSDAWQVFNRLAHRDEHSWTSLIQGHADCGELQCAFLLYEEMALDCANPSRHTFVPLLNACSELTWIKRGRELHAEIVIRGFDNDIFLGDTLVDMYAKCDSLTDAQEVFDKLSERGVVSWTALIGGYANQGLSKEALKFLTKMQEADVSPNPMTCVCGLKASGNVEDIDEGQVIHTLVAKEGFEDDPFVSTSLIDMYARCGLMVDAQAVFDELEVHNAVMWTALMAGYTEQGLDDTALCCLKGMQAEGATPTPHTYVCSLKACGRVEALEQGREIHDDIVKKGYEHSIFVDNSLIEMYVKCSSLEEARAMFDGLPSHDAVLWTTLMMGFSDQGLDEEALNCFDQMQVEGARPTAISYNCILKACGSMGAINRGQELHDRIVKEGLEQEISVGTALVDMYARCNLFVDAQVTFDDLPVRSMTTWTALITRYAEQGLGEKAETFFKQMFREGICPDALTFTSSLKVCDSIGYLDRCQELHIEIIKHGLEQDPIISSALVDAYANCGALAESQELFNLLPVRDVVSWTSLISHYVENACDDEAWNCLYEMQFEEGISPNSVTLVWILKSCGTSEAIDKGQGIHDWIVKKGLERDSFVGNALVSMYAKCGLFLEAQEVFNKLPIQSVDSWTALIVGYSEGGYDKDALRCLELMLQDGVSPDFTSLLFTLKASTSLCDVSMVQGIHKLVVQKGLEADHSICSALIDNYATCGLLAEADSVFDYMPSRNVSLWTSLIDGYAEHGLIEEVHQSWKQMQSEGVSPDPLTFVCSLKSCDLLEPTSWGWNLHDEILLKGFESEPLVGSRLVNMYARCGLLAEATCTFTKLPTKDATCMTALLAGYAEYGHCEDALTCLEVMQESGITPIAYIHTLKACSTIEARETGEKIYQEITKKGLDKISHVCSAVMAMYSKCGLLAEVQEVFNKLSVKDVVSWTGLLSVYIEHGLHEKALKCFDQMQEESLILDHVTLACCLKACTATGAIIKGQEVHNIVNMHGLETDPFISSCLVDMYAKCSSIAETHIMFDMLPAQNIFAWTALVTMYSEHELHDEVLNCVEVMQAENLSPNIFIFVCALKACGRIGIVDEGMELHMEIVKGGLEIDSFLGSALVGMYGKCGQFSEAKEVINKLPVQNLIVWNALITGYAEYGLAEEVIGCWEQIQKLSMSPDKVTFICSLKACNSLGSMSKGQEIHTEIAKVGLDGDLIITSVLITMYANGGFVQEAQQIFDRFPVQDVVLWTTLIAGYAKHNRYGEAALNYLDQMRLEGIHADAVTYACSLKACVSIGALNRGRELHAEIVKEGFEGNPYIGSSLMKLYAMFGFLLEAQEVFDELVHKDLVSWAAFLSGFGEHGLGCEVLKGLERMCLEGMPVSAVDFVSRLKACLPLVTMEGPQYRNILSSAPT